MVSKLNSDRKPGEGAGAAISRIYKTIGLRGLFNGLGVRIVMIGTLTGAQWLIYDSFKVSLGVSGLLMTKYQKLMRVLASDDWRPLIAADDAKV
jgi:hypothetical protein